MAKEIQKADIGGIPRKSFEFDFSNGYDSYQKQAKPIEEKLYGESAAIVKSGKLAPGFLMHFPIADGRAVYRVESLKPLTVQHVPLGDAWRIPASHMRGIRLADVEQQFRGERLFQ